MPREGAVSAVILAAGLSSRLGENKLLLKLGERAVVQHVVDHLLHSRAAEVIVVAGHQWERVITLLDLNRVRLVVNPNYARGQSTSLHEGVMAVNPASRAVLFALGDQPLISAALVNRLIETYHQVEEALIVAPRYQGRRGNPVLFDGSLKPELLTVEGDQGARQLIEKHEGEIAYVEVESPAVFLDVDSPEDYERVLREHDRL